MFSEARLECSRSVRVPANSELDREFATAAQARSETILHRNSTQRRCPGRRVERLPCGGPGPALPWVDGGGVRLTIANHCFLVIDLSADRVSLVFRWRTLCHCRFCIRVLPSRIKSSLSIELYSRRSFHTARSRTVSFRLDQFLDSAGSERSARRFRGTNDAHYGRTFPFYPTLNFPSTTRR